MSAYSLDRPPNSSAPFEMAVRRCRGILVAVAVFSGVINILALTGSFYMLQVYDRVLPSRSIPTLVGLTVLLALLYAVNGALDLIRLRIMSRLGQRIDRELRGPVFDAVQRLSLSAPRRGDGLQPVRHLDAIRTYLSGLGPAAFFDLPWLPVYLLVITPLHPWLGLFSTAGAVVFFGLALLTEVRTAGAVRASAASGARRLAFGEMVRRNAEAVAAMGFGSQMARRWEGCRPRT